MKTKLLLEVNEVGKIDVQLEGLGTDLVNMLMSAMTEDKDIREIICCATDSIKAAQQIAKELGKKG